MNTLEIIGQRLRQARETVGYTPEEVSQKLGITVDELLLFESGRKGPPLSVMQKLAKLYGVFDSYFYGIDKVEGTAFTLLLDKAKELSLPPETISQVHRFIFLCSEIVKLRQRLGIPKPEIPSNLDNQADLGELLEDMGIPVIRMPLGRELASAMVYDEDFGAFILVNSDCPNPNQLIAHEYGHILQGEKVHLNVPAKDCPKATLRSKPPVSKVLWELVLTAVKHEFITTSYASELLEISPMEIEDILNGN
jgi:transcriptional regulator with XRE-family HTH domain